MKKIKSLFIRLAFLSLGVLTNAYANNEQMNATLVNIVNQIDAIMPLIDEAETQQNKQSAVQFHFETFTDKNGQQHNGLRQDLLEIKRSVIAQINHPAMEPRTLAPLQNDYIGQ